MSPNKPTRVCVIGAGPSGMSVLHQLDEMSKTETVPDVVCYEKQGTWGGQWNFTWMTGTDEYGELCHSGIYRHLWTNVPKEIMELPNYTFDDHYKKPVPSYLSAGNVREYIEGHWTTNRNNKLSDKIEFNTVVVNVAYNTDTDMFHIKVRNLKTDTIRTETFSHVVVATGIFAFPYKPVVPGLDDFPGRVIHSHDFREAKEFKGQRILNIGGNYSASDIAMQCVKYGAKEVTCSWKSQPFGCKWPNNVTEKPLVKKVEGNTVYFIDGSFKEVDAIIICTGYLAKFPFMEDNLAIKTNLSLYPDNLYKGLLFVNDGNKKLFYIGVQNQLFTFPMFDLQALWICRYIKGKLSEEPNTAGGMRKDINTWLQKLASVKTRPDMVDFQTSYVKQLADILDYNTDITKVSSLYYTWLSHIGSELATYRDNSFTSIHTGTKAVPSKPWLKQLNDLTFI